MVCSIKGTVVCLPKQRIGGLDDCVFFTWFLSVNNVGRETLICFKRRFEMIVKEGRTRLDQALKNPKFTVLLLSGPKESKAGETHAAVAARQWEPWRKCFLVTDLSLLSNSEKTRWFGGDRIDRYALMSGKNQTKTVKKKGPIQDLLRANGKPSYLKIRLAYTKEGGRS